MDTTLPPDIVALARTALSEALEALRWVMAQKDKGKNGPEMVRRAATTLLTTTTRLLGLPPRPSHPRTPTPLAMPNPAGAEPIRPFPQNARAPASLVARAGAIA
ncbi:MAG: hypothetical protein KF866_02235 [Phycisphaeraceae bacterium]|nr:hypothetical protein [Phycisphaeraceae bacterium]MCW5753488.1 hypothetical protein [Phycisphaeraceae bacterium]